MSKVKVKRKVRVTIPFDVRGRFKIQDGSVLEVGEQERGILLKHGARVRSGEVVGEQAYKKILQDLEALRRKWR